MNKKFFAALASATMAFTASGSIAVFADDFVEEKTPVVDGNVAQPEKTVKWNKENFGDLATEDNKVNDKVSFTATVTPDKDGYVKVDDLKNVTTITLKDKFDGELKGLEYFTKLETFTAKEGTLTNKTLDFSVNTALKTLEVTNAADLTELTFPKADENEEFQLTKLVLSNTKLTTLDLSEQPTLGDVTVEKNYNLKDVVVRHGTKNNKAKYTNLKLNNNALETVNLDNVKVETELNISGNHIGVLDLSKAEVTTTATLGDQTFYVSEDFDTVNLKETFENFDVEKVTEPTDAGDYDKETGVLTLKESGVTTYKYNTELGNATTELVVKIEKANPMHRLYNPNSGEHFYTADAEEKEALVKLGWNDEGYGWVAKETPAKGQEAKYAVYRLYNPNAGDHHYTMNPDEVKTLVAYGWKDEGTGWYSTVAKDASKQDTDVEVYRQYNPFANGAGSHNYTVDKAENDYLVSLGWTPEGTAWYAYR